MNMCSSICARGFLLYICTADTGCPVGCSDWVSKSFLSFSNPVSWTVCPFSEATDYIKHLARIRPIVFLHKNTRVNIKYSDKQV